MYPDDAKAHDKREAREENKRPILAFQLADHTNDGRKREDEESAKDSAEELLSQKECHVGNVGPGLEARRDDKSAQADDEGPDDGREGLEARPVGLRHDNVGGGGDAHYDGEEDADHRQDGAVERDVSLVHLLAENKEERTESLEEKH